MDNNVAHLEALLAEEAKQTKARNLQQWRQLMKAAGKGATVWLKPTLTLPAAVCYKGNEGNLAYSNGGESHFDELKRFWNPIWQREVRQLDPESYQRWQNAAGSAMHSGADDPFSLLSGPFLHKQAQSLRGSAGGVDGWSGTETADWPVKAWDIFLTLVKRWAQRGQYPRCWQQLRQVHLPKPTATCHNGAYFASDLRPISVLACSWRVLTSSMAKCPATVNWTAAVLNNQCHGGRNGHDVFSAAAKLAESFYSSDAILVTLDYAKAFDYVSPQTGLTMLEHCGFPAVWCSFLRHTWSNQQRWLQMCGTTSATACKVEHSLPQGDGLSPLTLNIMLGAAAQDVRAQLNTQEFEQVLFLDDRTFVTTSGEVVAQALQLWQWWSEALGLKENQNKMTVVARRPARQAELIQLGLPANSLCSRARVLGFDFCADSRDSDRPTAAERRNEALKIAKRIALIPGDLQTRRTLWRSRVIPKATWGHILRLPAQAEWNPLRAALKKVVFAHRSGSVALLALLEGHTADCEFYSGYMAFNHFLRLSETAVASIGGVWLRTIVGFIGSLGFARSNNGSWFHSDFDASMDLNQVPLASGQRQLWLHYVREAWRRKLFHTFVSDGCSRARELGGSRYDEGSCKVARKLFLAGDGHTRAVLTGAVWSLAKYDKVLYEINSYCPFCNMAVVPDWHHLAWECSHMAEGRPPVPQLAIQARIGWPSARQTEAQAAIVVRHLAKVRMKCLEFFYGTE